MFPASVRDARIHFIHQADGRDHARRGQGLRSGPRGSALDYGVNV